MDFCKKQRVCFVKKFDPVVTLVLTKIVGFSVKTKPTSPEKAPGFQLPVSKELSSAQSEKSKSQHGLS